MPPATLLQEERESCIKNNSASGHSLLHETQRYGQKYDARFHTDDGVQSTLDWCRNSTTVYKFQTWWWRWWRYDGAPGEVGQRLDGLCDEGEVALNALLWHQPAQTKQTRRQDGGAQQPQEDARTDQLTSHVTADVTVTLCDVMTLCDVTVTLGDVTVTLLTTLS